VITGAANRALGEFLRKHNLGVRETARLLGTDASFISRVVNGQRPVTPRLKVRFDRVFCQTTSPRFLPDAIRVSIVIGEELDRIVEASVPEVEISEVQA